MSPPSAVSQPAYPALGWDASGTQHVLFAAADDAALAQRLLATPPRGPLTLIRLDQGGTNSAGANDATTPSAWSVALPPDAQHSSTDRLTLALQRLHEVLSMAHMGARLYLVGNEDLLWQASRVADRFAICANQVRRYRVATLARPVFCVHCRALTRGVTTNVVDCGGCGRALFVRNHFSRRLGAYMGFQIDAEAPGNIPAMEELYP